MGIHRARPASWVRWPVPGNWPRLDPPDGACDGLDVVVRAVGRGPVAPVVRVTETVTVVPLFWTGMELTALRRALSMSVREFARHLGVSARAVSKWEAAGGNLRPVVVNQAAAYTCLEWATPWQRALFTAWLAQPDVGECGPHQGARMPLVISQSTATAMPIPMGPEGDLTTRQTTVDDEAAADGDCADRVRRNRVGRYIGALYELGPEEPIPRWVWHRSNIVEALAARDTQAVFSYLQTLGLTQVDIATRAGQTPSEVSEIVGGRRVRSYDLLTRIADGLGIPRGYLGLAYQGPAAGDESTPSAAPAGEDEVGYVDVWTGQETRLLRLALRMTLAEFAAHLGVGVDAVGTWEARDRRTRPRSGTQAALHTALEQADRASRLRFGTAVAKARDAAERADAHPAPAPAGPHDAVAASTDGEP
jgi:transcriptional regulator with XRE-family HTH domain